MKRLTNIIMPVVVILLFAAVSAFAISNGKDAKDAVNLFSNIPWIKIIIGIFLLVFASMSIKVIPQAEKAVVEKIGKYSRTLDSGLNFLLPMIERIAYQESMREQVMDIDPQPAITKDNVTLQVDTVVFYKIVDLKKMAYGVANIKMAIKQLAITTMRAKIGELELDRALSSRDDINQTLTSGLDEATDAWGVKITRVEVKNIDPPKDIEEAMAKQMKAEREKRAMVLQAEGKKESAIKESEGRKAAAINVAEGEKKAAIAKAEGEAEAREKKAAAEAKAIEAVAKAIKEEGKDATNYYIAQAYITSLEEVGKSNSSKIVFLPLEAQNLLGSLGGIKELITNINGGTRTGA